MYRYSTTPANGGGLECHQIGTPGGYYVNKQYPVEPMNIIASLSIQNGSWTPDPSTPFPGSFEIDYIRYYKPVTNEVDQVLIFPNPTSGMLSVFLPGDAGHIWLELIDEKGKTVYSNEFFGRNRIEISLKRLAKGIYILKGQGGKADLNFSSKVVYH
jgi:hypothetical protein